MRLFILTSSLVLVSSALNEFLGYDACHGQIECSACISHRPNCAWCSDEGIDKAKRCRSFDKGYSTCQDRTFPVGDRTVKIVDETNFGDNATDGTGIVQIKPRKVAAKVRKGGTITFDVNVQPARDYPLDLYFLMDLSHSMKPTLDVLKASVNEMSAKLKTLTLNHRIGFGTFVDKTTGPFITTSPEKLLNPCEASNPCEPAYNFNNTVSLNEYQFFDSLIGASKVSASVDTPEAGMDALMQVATCTEPIGWRNHSRKVIVYLADTGFHFAGDGKLGGQIERNDGKCWVLDGRTYSKEKVLDYPSIYQVVKRVVENKMIPIFGVKPEIESLYQDLVKLFPAASLGILSENSNNLVDLIVENYRNISSKIEPRQTRPMPGVTMTHVAYCPENENKAEPGGSCSQVGIEEKARFRFTITADQCLKDDTKMMIEFAGFGTLSVDLRTLCECPCDSDETDGVDVCGGNGGIKCGACSCDPGWSGEVCDCSEDSESHLELCKRPGSDLICTDSGRCQCGNCTCKGENYGKYCQCNNQNCRCGENGECICPDDGDLMCKCNPGWTGEYCDCSTDTSKCMFSGKECNGHGTCECGECKCTTDGYSGKFCHHCPYCDKCEDYLPCVKCLVGYVKEDGTKVEGKLLDDCSECYDRARSVEQTTLREEEVVDGFTCTHVVEDCEYLYFYKDDLSIQDTTRTILYVNQEPDCGPISVIWIIVGLILAIVLLGIIIICCWKCITMYKDKKEYKRFMEDMEKTKFAHTMSPLYNSPITKVENPIAKKM